MRGLLLAFGVAVLAACGVGEAKSRPHHKVHNLALYPERHSWCQATPIRQEIGSSDPECSAATIDNVVCLGACFSYSVPRAQDDVLIEPYCDACRPTRSSWTVVSLNCTRAATGEHFFLPRNVELIANCSCVDCNSANTRHQHAHDEDDSSGDSGEEFDNTESHEGDTIEGASNHHIRPAPDNSHKNSEAKEEDPEEVEGVGGTGPHNLLSVSAESKGVSGTEEDLMIKDNKISPDDDDEEPHRRQG